MTVSLIPTDVQQLELKEERFHDNSSVLDQEFVHIKKEEEEQSGATDRPSIHHSEEEDDEEFSQTEDDRRSSSLQLHLVDESGS